VNAQDTPPGSRRPWGRAVPSSLRIRLFPGDENWTEVDGKVIEGLSAVVPTQTGCDFL